MISVLMRSVKNPGWLYTNVYEPQIGDVVSWSKEHGKAKVVYVGNHIRFMIYESIDKQLACYDYIKTITREKIYYFETKPVSEKEIQIALDYQQKHSIKDKLP